MDKLLTVKEVAEYFQILFQIKFTNEILNLIFILNLWHNQKNTNEGAEIACLLTYAIGSGRAVEASFSIIRLSPLSSSEVF